MLRIALTGNIGSGKSTVAEFFKECGFYVFDADRIIKGFYEERGKVYEEVLKAFGYEILDQGGNINTKKLADIVFADREKLLLLERITHSALYERLNEEFKKLPEHAIAVVEASLVLEKKTQGRYDFVVLVYAPYELCKQRVLSKGMSLEDFERRWQKQLPPEEKLKKAHYLIDNSQSLERTRERVFELCKVFKNLALFQRRWRLF